MSIGSLCTLWKCDISNDLDGPLTRFSRSQHFWSRISKKRCVSGTKLLKNTNRKPSTDTTFDDHEWTLIPISRSRHFFKVEYRKKGPSERQSYYCTIGNYTWYMEWYYVCWPRLTAKRVAPLVSISWASCTYDVQQMTARKVSLCIAIIAVYHLIALLFMIFTAWRYV